MKPLLYGLCALFCYVAYALHWRGETVWAALPVFAAGVAYGLIKQESPQP